MTETRPWWEHRALIALAVLVAGLPLWLPAIPPLTDLPGHMGRYFVQLDAGRSADLSRWYAFDWHWIGNLGVDLIVQAMGPWLGVETATKLVAILIPMLTAAGFLAVAREVHGGIPPTAFFALPLAWSYPFLWGFVNFALSMALAFLAFALWLNLARRGRLRLRFVLFAGISLLLWTAHIYGWASLCVLAASAELVRQLDRQNGLRALPATALNCVCLLPPLVPMLLKFSGGGAGGQPFAHTWFRWDLKIRWAASILRDRWEIFDIASVLLLLAIVLAGLVVWALRRTRPKGLVLVIAAGLFGLLFILMPHALIGSAYADMRLAPFALATALLAIGGPAQGWIAALGLGFFGLRIAGTALSMAEYDAIYRTELSALAHVPQGAQLVSFVGRPCAQGWAVHRLDHLPSIALIRRRAFANDQWQAAGAQLITVHYAAGGAFVADPSQFVVEPRCERAERKALPRAVASFPRDAFDYVWIIDQPEGAVDLTGLERVWHKGRSALYRVVRTGSRR